MLGLSYLNLKSSNCFDWLKKRDRRMVKQNNFFLQKKRYWLKNVIGKFSLKMTPIANTFLDFWKIPDQRSSIQNTILNLFLWKFLDNILKYCCCQLKILSYRMYRKVDNLLEIARIENMSNLRLKKKYSKCFSEKLHNIHKKTYKRKFPLW